MLFISLFGPKYKLKIKKVFFLFFFVLTMFLKWGCCLNTSAVVCEPGGFLPYVEIKDIGRCVKDTQTEAECQQAAETFEKSSGIYFGSLDDKPTKFDLPFGCLMDATNGNMAFNPYRSGVDCSSTVFCVCKPTSCNLCPKGAYCPNATSQILCPKGTFNNITGQTTETSCKTCSIGYVELSGGATACSICNKGAYCPNAKSQILCPKGTFNNITGQTMETSCKNCSYGYIALSSGATACSICNKGAYCPNAKSQILCPKGTFNNITGQTTETSCKNCFLSGYVSLSTDATACSICNKGAYCPNAKSQILCPKGTFNDLEGETMVTSCKNCSYGYVALTMALYGSLYLAYERPYWYWESVEMLKKMILAGGLVIMAAGSSAQVLIGMLVALAYFTVVMQLKPYEDIVDDYLQVGASIQMVLNLLIGLVLKLDDKSEYDVDTLGIILLMMNIAVVLIGVGLACLAFPKVQTCCSKKKKAKKEVKKVEMVNIINPIHTKKKKSEVVVEVQPKKKPSRRSIATEERMKRIRRLSANRRPSASVLNALNLKDLEVDKTAYI